MAKVNWYDRKVVSTVDSISEQVMKKAVLMVEADAKRYCPVDTGRLRASITSAVEKIKRDVINGRVGTNVEYAPYQELGTSKMDAQPYLRPALEKNYDKIVRMFRRAL